MRSTTLRALAVAALLPLAACDNDNVFIGEPGGSDPPGQPRDLVPSYTWVLDGFDQAGQSIGYPAVDLAWLPPTDWNNEPFRVYGKRASSSSFFLVGTVTSCTVSGCAYRDRNVASGETYEYYVAAVNENTDEETATEFREVIRVPAFSRPAAPLADSVTALDNAAYLRWRANGNAASLSRFIVYLTRLDAQTTLYHMGETDGNGFLDQRAENGHRYGYRVAAVDTFGHVSALSAEIVGTPRPDRTAELVYAHADDPTRSGFRFVNAESSNPILAGTSASAHWRLETTATGWRIVPLNGVSVASFGLTTALVCGPGADADCVAATRAPATGYQTTPIDVSQEFSYIFRIPGTDGVRHGVARVSILGSDQQGRDLMIFDWAYQTVANEPRLNVSVN